MVITPKQDIVDGPFGSNLKSSEYVDLVEFQSSEYKILTDNHFINKNIHYVTKEKSEQLNRHSFSKNDVVITKLGIPVGKACLVPEYLDKWTYYLVDFPMYEQKFLYFLLKQMNSVKIRFFYGYSLITT